MNKSLFFVILFLGSCTEFDQTIDYRIDPELTPFINSFFDEAAKRGIKIPKENLYATFSKKETNPFYPGVSTKEGYQRSIYFDRYTFDTNTPEENEVMVFHELGHAILLLHHCDCSMNNIMSAEANTNMYSMIDRNQILDDFFYSK